MSAMTRSTPLVGLTGLWIEPPAPGRTPRVALAHGYADALLRAGALPVVLPSVGDGAALDGWLDALDGLVFSGGDDFDTERLGLGATHPSADPVPHAKQDWDLALARRALERELPVLGVCYGMQLMGLACGARLLQHLPDDRPGGREHAGGVVHSVRVEAGSKLAGALGVETVDVVSRHHQALADVAAPFAVCARDDEGLIEGIEHTSHPFAVGVQWHPELSPPGGPMDALLAAFVDAAARSRALAGAHSDA